MFNTLHGEVESVVDILSILAHGVVSTNSADNHELMKAVLIEACFKMEAILALQDEINAAFDVDLTDDDEFPYNY